MLFKETCTSQSKTLLRKTITTSLLLFTYKVFSVFHWYCGKHVIYKKQTKTPHLFLFFLTTVECIRDATKCVSHLFQCCRDKMIINIGTVSAKTHLCYVLTDTFIVFSIVLNRSDFCYVFSLQLLNNLRYPSERKTVNNQPVTLPIHSHLKYVHVTFQVSREHTSGAVDSAESRLTCKPGEGRLYE